MELVKKNIHTERIKAKALLQIPLEEDINVSDSRPDVGKPVFTRGKIKVDEVKSGTNKVWVKGRLVYQILYLAEGKDSGLAGMEGELPFMEEIYMDMVESTDRAICNTNLEDMRVNLINSRKLSIQAVISLMPRVEENTQEEVCVDLNGAEKEQAKGGKELEYRKKPLDYLETAVSKRDLFRIHEENKLPAGLPAVGTVIWRSTAIQHVNFKPLSEKIAVGGELSLFLIYKEDISGRTNWYETTMPFSGNIECQGCEEMMTADIAYEVGHEEITVREDSDGEARMLGVELALELEIKLLQKESSPIVADVYGVSCEVAAISSPKKFRQLQQDAYLEEKLTGTVKPDGIDTKILQICHSEAKPEIENCIFGDDEIEIRGSAEVQVLYLNNEDGNNFAMAESRLPFTITRKLSGLRKDMEYNIENCSLKPQLEQLHVVMKDGERIEWQAVLTLHLMLYGEAQEEILTDLKITELDSSKLEKLPGFAIYFVKEGDTLWQIGRKYYVSVDKIKEVNQLTSEDITPGDKLLIVKSGEI